MLIARLGLLAGLAAITGCSGADLSKAAPVKSLSAAELCADLAPRLKNGYVASHPLADKVVEIHGEVIAAHPGDIHGEVHLDGESSSIRMVACFFGKQAPQIKSVRVGDRGTIRGRCGGVVSDDRKRWVCVFDSFVVK